MDPALAALDFAKAGAILADMIASRLAAGALPFDPEGHDDHDLEDRRSTPIEAGLRIRSPVDAGAGPLEPGEHGPPIQSAEQGPIAPTWPAMAREKAQAAPTARPKVPMRRRGADCPVVVTKRGNARGAKGAGHCRGAWANRVKSGTSPRIQRTAASFLPCHEPDDARVSSPVL